MHDFAKAEDNPSVSTGHDCQCSRPPVCHVLPRGCLWNDANQPKARLVRFAVALLLAFWVLLARPPAQAQIPTDPYWTITTVAGTSEDGYSGDGGPAVEAKLRPEFIAVDGTGNLYILQYSRIRRVDSKGTITTITTVADGREFIYVSDFAADGAGNLYFTSHIFDTTHIRRMDSNGTFTTLAGTRGAKSFARDDAGNLYYGALRVIFKMDAGGIITTFAGTSYHEAIDSNYIVDGTPAVEAEFESLGGMTVDGAGNLYFSAYQHARIYKVDSMGKVTTVAGTGELGYSGDGGPAVEAELLNLSSAVAVDGAGNLYIAEDDQDLCLIRKVDSAGTITTVAGGKCGGWFFEEPARSRGFWGIRDMTVDDAGNLYIADARRIYKLAPNRHDQ